MRSTSSRLTVALRSAFSASARRWNLSASDSAILRAFSICFSRSFSLRPCCWRIFLAYPVSYLLKPTQKYNMTWGAYNNSSSWCRCSPSVADLAREISTAADSLVRLWSACSCPNCLARASSSTFASCRARPFSST